MWTGQLGILQQPPHAVKARVVAGWEHHALVLCELLVRAKFWNNPAIPFCHFCPARCWGWLP